MSGLAMLVDAHVHICETDRVQAAQR